MRLYFTYGYIKPASHLLQDPRLHPAESSLASFTQPRHAPCSTVSALPVWLRPAPPPQADQGSPVQVSTVGGQ